MPGFFRAIRFSTKARIILGLLAVGLYLSAPALAQSSRDIMNRLTRLENELQTLSRAVYKGETPPPSAYSGDAAANAGTEVRLQQLESELRNLTGRVEEQDYNIRQMQEKLDRALSDIDLRLQDAASGRGAGTPPSSGFDQRQGQYIQPDSGSGASSSANPPYPQSGQTGQNDPYQWSSRTDNVSGSGPSGQRLGTLSSSSSAVPADQGAVVYEDAYTLLKNGDQAGAEAGFKAFLKQYPKHSLASNAKYWLGETYYVRGDYDQAARTFAEAYQEYPQGAKAADNLLKLGMSLAGQGKNNDACVALAQVEKEFPNAGPVLHRATQEMSRLGC